MRQRCLTPTHKHYADYGGRGITICPEWDSFEQFLADMGEAPAGKSLDRHPDKNGNYEKGNCRWATRREQQQNLRSNVNIEHAGEILCKAEWARRAGISRGLLQLRLRTGWSVERALSTPSRQQK